MSGELVDIGYVARAHGIAGELRVVCHNPESTALLDADELVIGGRRMTIAGLRPVAGAFLVAVDGIDDRDAAEALRGQPVAVDRSLLDLAPGEVLLDDLVGCQAIRSDGTPMGEVIGVEVGAQDRLVISDGTTEWLLPVVPVFVTAVDRDRRQVTVDPPDGLPGTPARPRK